MTAMAALTCIITMMRWLADCSTLASSLSTLISLRPQSSTRPRNSSQKLCKREGKCIRQHVSRWLSSKSVKCTRRIDNLVSYGLEVSREWRVEGGQVFGGSVRRHVIMLHLNLEQRRGKGEECERKSKQRSAQSS